MFLSWEIHTDVFRDVELWGLKWFNWKEKEIYTHSHIYREMDNKYGKMLTIGEFKWRDIWVFNVLIHSMYFIIGSEFSKVRLFF